MNDQNRDPRNNSSRRSSYSADRSRSHAGSSYGTSGASGRSSYGADRSYTGSSYSADRSRSSAGSSYGTSGASSRSSYSADRNRSGTGSSYSANRNRSGYAPQGGYSSGGSRSSDSNPGSYNSDGSRSNYPPRNPEQRRSSQPYGDDAPRRSAQPSQGAEQRYSAQPSQGAESRYSARPSQGAEPRYSSQPSRTTEQRRISQPSRTTESRRSSQPRQTRRSSAPRKRGDNILLKILKGVGLVFFAILAGIGKLLSALNHKLDRFRKSETSAVIVNAIVGGVLVTAALCILLACKPGIDSARARSSAAAGNAEKAVKLVNSLEADGYDAQKLEQTRAAVVEGFIKSGKFTEADAMLLEMQEGATRSELQQRSSYAHAVALYEEGDYTQAAQIFYQLDSYSDSALRYADCRCALAILAWQEGNEASAHSLLLDVPDAVERVTKAAQKIAGSAAEAQAILAADIFSEASLNQLEQTMEELSAARSEMPESRIAAGKRHSLAATGAGTALAAGDNSYGQCDVSAWSGIRQVAAGAYHSVGLRSDGTVVATGDNSRGQCDVSGWTDVVAIAAASYDTIGLRSDGSVVACGMHSSLVSGWHDVRFITGGSYSLGCLYDKGAMLSTHKGAQLDMGVMLYDLSVCGQVSVGVLYDGTMVSSFDGAPAWEGMVTVTACEAGILGVGVDGQVRSFFYREGDGVDISVPGKAVEVESSGTHHLVLTEDGRVYGFGANDYGQCEVSAWQL